MSKENLLTHKFTILDNDHEFVDYSERGIRDLLSEPLSEYAIDWTGGPERTGDRQDGSITGTLIVWLPVMNTSSLTA